MLTHINNTPPPHLVVASYSSSVTTIPRPKLAQLSDPARTGAVSAPHHGSDLCNWHWWPWSCMASGTAVEAITPSSSIYSKHLSFPLPPQIWSFYEVEFWGNSQRLTSPRGYTLPGPGEDTTFQAAAGTCCLLFFSCSAAAPFSKAEAVFSQLSRLPCLNNR